MKCIKMSLGAQIYKISARQFSSSSVLIQFKPAHFQNSGTRPSKRSLFLIACSMPRRDSCICRSVGNYIGLVMIYSCSGTLYVTSLSQFYAQHLVSPTAALSIWRFWTCTTQRARACTTSRSSVPPWRNCSKIISHAMLGLSLAPCGHLPPRSSQFASRPNLRHTSI